MIRFLARTNGIGYTLVYFELPNWMLGEAKRVVAKQIEEHLGTLRVPTVLLLRGQGPVWLYSMLTEAALKPDRRLRRPFNVATFDPRECGYVVTARRGGPWQPGEIIPEAVVGMTVANDEIVDAAEAKPRNVLTVAVGGPPHCGKSVFLAEFYRQLLSRKRGEVVLQRACPDGEGMWSAECNPALAQAIRQKGQFTPNFCAWITDVIEREKRGFPLVLLDLGGKLMPPNDAILRASSHLLVLAADNAEADEWVRFGREHNCSILGVLRSVLSANARSSVDLTAEPIQGELVNLDRSGPVAPYQETVSQIADWLIPKLEG